MRWKLSTCQLSPVNLCDRPPPWRPDRRKCKESCRSECSPGGSATECRYSQAGNYRCSTKSIPGRCRTVCERYCYSI